MTRIFRYFSIFILMLGTLSTLIAQEEIVDEISAIVGNNIILKSEIEAQYFQYRMQEGIKGSETTVKCSMMEDFLYQKLLLNQAEVDSIEVSDSEVELSMDQRLRYFISQFGSEEKLEEFYDKSILEIKEEMRELVREQMMVEEVQRNITTDVSITPSEVRSFYRKLPEDSIPYINAQVEVAQIVKYPPVSIEQKLLIKEKLKNIRERIISGESFKALAILYSEDPGSAKKGGELGFHGRGELYPEFEAVAFKLKKGEVSEILETKAGFHIIELLERRGDYVNVRHILLRVKPTPQDLVDAKNYLDSIADLIEKDSITFVSAVQKYSDDPNKNNAGMIINPATGATKWDAEELDPQMFFVIDKLEVGEISKPVLYENEEGKQAYRILRLETRTKPHRANMREDYNALQEWALNRKKQNEIDRWIKEKIYDAYIRIDEEFWDCKFTYDWFKADLE
ncbi:MAG: peptidylprolyl isomerase [Bacteroidales bacterium]|nr:peptidylprolyl isomerase [Bacteroidales bacterium]MCF8387139.1 peptidylprolyl isomerase [Bacteroidales bacterium]MCF8398866.1 peptidylprolyl isomerase [Bacteroidales bacterium]